MTRPLKLVAHQIGRDYGIDAEIVMTWPSNKILEYMAYTRCLSSEFQEKFKEENMSPEQKAQQIMKMFGG